MFCIDLWLLRNQCHLFFKISDILNAGSAFTQQELPACKPLLTPKWVITIFMLIGVVFIPIGVAALFASRNVVEIIDEYQTVCVPGRYTTNGEREQFIQDVNQDKHCNRTLTVSKLMKGPVYVYYQLDNFYQNHRRYVKSRSDKQLLDGNATDTSACKPEQYLSGDLAIVPCGLIAWSLFNDTYNISADGQQVTINKKGISWKSDREHKFGNVRPQYFPNNLPRDLNGSLIGGASLDPNTTLNEDEDLIVWMRTAALPTFRKLYGKIEQDLAAGSTLSITINNVYNTYSFGGKKKLVLSTTSWLGGKNDFLGVAYITVGSLCVFLALLFFLVHWRYPRRLGDTKYLSWNQHASAN
ncbi:hypothetical protein KP509_15G020400 [Ceratopteris richardii]|uniref:ALA-interacting subunit n=1 Tax=Ceratopteris richardii TaxID=49495 RepID=A0A8T2T2H6_CERRI|nr:hypothetical protein KP509_15G020400 [Ceratopteris richardii]